MARINPLTYIVDAAPNLFAGNIVASTLMTGTGASVAVLVVGLTVGLTAVHNDGE